MKAFIIGYVWCPYFQKAKTRLCNELTHVHVIELTCEEPDRELIEEHVRKIIGHRTVIGQVGVTSPQILCCNKTTAVCIAGASELDNITNVLDYVKHARYRTYVQRNHGIN